MELVGALFGLLEALPKPVGTLANEEDVRKESPLPPGHAEPKHSQEGSPNESVEQNVPNGNMVNSAAWWMTMNWTHQHRNMLRCSRYNQGSQVDNNSESHQDRASNRLHNHSGGREGYLRHANLLPSFVVALH